jgi:hypothetical protein
MRKYYKQLILITVFLFTTQTNFSQVGIATTTPNADALLEINSTVLNPGGVLLPRMNLTMTTSPAPLSADVRGMIVYNTASVGDVTPGFYYNDGAIWIRLGSLDWSLNGNAGTTYGTNFIGTTDNTDIAISRNSVTKIRIEDTRTTFSNEIRTRDGGTDAGDILVNIYDSNDDGIIDVNENNVMNHRIHGNGVTIFNDLGINTADLRIESDTNNRMFAVDSGDDQVRINDGDGYFAGSNHFMSSTNDADEAIVGYTTGAGYAISAQSNGAAAGAIVSITTAASTSIPVYALPQNVAPGVYSDASTNAGSDDAVVGIADNNAGFGGGWFLNTNSGGNGTGYGSAQQGYGVLGMNNTGNQYSAGAFGSVDDSGRRSSGVYGTISNGTTSLASGSLGYRTSAGGGGTFYGGYFWDNNGGVDHTDGNGKYAEDSGVKVNVGIGAVGGLMGGWIKGDIYGMTTKGERYSLYVNGREFTNDVITQLSNNENSKQRTATYVPTSTSVDITSKGTGHLSNGSGRVVFNKHFSSIASSKDPIIVTVTPLGQSNGVYLASVDKNGFTIKENNNGTATTAFTWIAMATKSGYETISTPKELLAIDYDKKLDNFMINENLDNDGKTHEMWWNGNEIKYSGTPEVTTYSKNKNQSKVYKPRKKLQAEDNISFPKEDDTTDDGN